MLHEITQSDNIIIQGLRMLFFICLIFILLGCGKEQSNELVFFDFEADGELDRIHWKCHTLFSISDEHATHGSNSLRLELYPSKYPGWTPILKANDWRGFNRLCFDLYNPQKRDIRVTVRIDDSEDFPNYADRLNRNFVLRPGLNRIRMPLNELRTSGTDRRLELDHIFRFLLFMVNLDEKVLLYIDYVRLERS